MMISGPTPAASPMVMAMIGLDMSALLFARRDAQRPWDNGIAFEVAQEIAAVEERARSSEAARLGEYDEVAAPALGDRPGQARLDFTEQAQLLDAPCIEYGARGFAASSHQRSGKISTGRDQAGERGGDASGILRSAWFGGIEPNEDIRSLLKARGHVPCIFLRCGSRTGR